ncbi:hypothetical protein DXU04_01450 [Bradyrhizobium diazoefficiens]
MLPLPLAGEGWGEGLTATGQSSRGESPHPPLRGDLSRKRERSREPRLRLNHTKSVTLLLQMIGGNPQGA